MIEKAKLRQAAWREANREELLEKKRIYHSTYEHKRSPERRAQIKAWAQANSGRVCYWANMRHVMKKQAMPPWVTPEMQECIQDMYSLAAIMSKKVQHDVDHIVPLKGKTVCGLHVPWNLWVIPHLENECRPRNWTPCNMSDLDGLARNGLKNLVHL
jgi:hypothetical protein